MPPLVGSKPTVEEDNSGLSPSMPKSKHSATLRCCDATPQGAEGSACLWTSACRFLVRSCLTGPCAAICCLLGLWLASNGSWVSAHAVRRPACWRASCWHLLLVLLLGSSVTGTDGFDAKSEEVVVVHGRQLTTGTTVNSTTALFDFSTAISPGWSTGGGNPPYPFTWKSGGSTPSLSTGPSSGVGGSGSYYFAETSSPQSVQSVPSWHSLYSAPGPPSSQYPSEP